MALIGNPRPCGSPPRQNCHLLSGRKPALSRSAAERVAVRVSIGEVRRAVSNRGGPVCLRGASGGPTGRRRLYPLAGKELRRSRPARAALSVLMKRQGGWRRTGQFRSRAESHSQTLTPPGLSWLTHAFGTATGLGEFDTPSARTLGYSSSAEVATSEMPGEVRIWRTMHSVLALAAPVVN
jgi:hypothetical protein